MTKTTDVVVIGGGVIGSAIAWNLAEQQQQTLLVEKNQPGQEASAAAAGLLSVASGRSKRGPMYQLKRASQQLYPQIVRELEERTGIDIEYQTVGVLDLVRTDADEKNLAREFGVAYQHTKVLLKNGKRILKSPETWDKARYLKEINTALGD